MQHLRQFTSYVHMQPASLGIHADFFLPLDVSNPIQWQPIANRHRDFNKRASPGSRLQQSQCRSRPTLRGGHCATPQGLRFAPNFGDAGYSMVRSQMCGQNHGLRKVKVCRVVTNVGSVVSIRTPWVCTTNHPMGETVRENCFTILH